MRAVLVFVAVLIVTSLAAPGLAHADETLDPTPPTAPAAVRDYPFELGPFLGAQFWDHTDTDGWELGNGERSDDVLRRGTELGFRIGWMPLGRRIPLGIDAELAFDAGSYVAPVRSASLLGARAHVFVDLWHFKARDERDLTLRAVAGGGLDVLATRPVSGERDTDTRTEWGLALIYGNGSTQLRLDARELILPGRQQAYAHGLLVVAGLQLRFGE